MDSPTDYPAFDMYERLIGSKGNGAAKPVAPLEFTNPTTLMGKPIPPREWIVEDWLPAGVVTVLYGDGGTGKSLLAQQLMASCATHLPWAGRAVTSCRSLGLFCEDDAHELHRRQNRINDALGVTFDDLGDMGWKSGVGEDNILATVSSDGRMMPTKRFAQLSQAAKAQGARLVVVDTAAATFAGNENDRLQVQQFINLLCRIALDINGAVLLTAHPSRSGMASGSGDGGSTAWSNTARSRLSLTRPAPDGGAEPDANERLLTRKKANYAAAGDAIALRWTSGVLAPVNQQGSILGSITRVPAEQMFLALLDRYTERGVLLSHNSRASNYAPKAFAKHPDRDGYRMKDFDGAMSNLLATKQIRVGERKDSSRHSKTCLMRQDEPNS